MTDRKRQIPRNVVMLGLVSLFADLSTEMVYPLIPIYMTACLGRRQPSLA